MASRQNFSSDSEEEAETVFRSYNSASNTVVRTEEEEEEDVDIKRLERQLAALKSKKGTASSSQCRWV